MIQARHTAIKIAAILTMALLCVCNIAEGQDINAHKNRVNEIEKEIDYLNRQISNTQKKHKNTLSLSDPVGTDKDGNELTLMDLLFEKEDCVFDSVERSVKRERLLASIARILNDREYSVICLRYALKGGVPLPQREVANLMKISRSYISRIEKRAIEKLRAELSKEDFLE